MSGDANQPRRRFLGLAATTVAAASLGLTKTNGAFAGELTGAFAPPAKPASNNSFAPLKQIHAGSLDVAYAESGPAAGPPVILLHGWPYDIYSFVDVAPLLAAKGYRVIVPYLRGCGTTRFLSSDTVRNAQQAVVAVDVLALMDALEIRRAVIGGFDWGARTADIIAALWPERCKALVSVSGYLIGTPAANKLPLPPRADFSGGTSSTLPQIAGGRATTGIAAISTSSSGSSRLPTEVR